MIDLNARRRIMDLQRTKDTVDTITRNVQLQLDSQPDLISDPLKKVSRTVDQQLNVSAFSVKLLQQLLDALTQISSALAQDKTTAEIKDILQKLIIPEFPEQIKIDSTQTAEIVGAIKDIQPPVIPDSVSIKDLAKVINGLNDIKQTLGTLEPLSTISVDRVNSLPPVNINNWDELNNKLENLQLVTVKAIQAMQTRFPDSFKISNEVKVQEWAELLDGIEELKKGFNLLLKKEVGQVSFPSSSIPVEVQNWKVPLPVTNISINGLGGIVKSSAITVSSSATALPASALENRRGLVIYNNSGITTLYVGGSDVTVASGMPVPPGTYSPAIDAGVRMIMYGIVSTGSINVRVLESSDIRTGR